MKVHFIAIGGSAMHNLAIALHGNGFTITGSDDEIFEPSRTRLSKLGLLPPAFGWDPNRITTDLDAVILGMHAKKDNPELQRAKELGIKLFSYPEFLFEQAKTKKRIVIGGSHGKTTITAIILHVLKMTGKDCDYLVGAQLEGFDVMVRLTREATCMIFEGDEYLTSPIDPRPKFHLYQPHIALLSGISWDHINVFPTFQTYVDQFIKFINLIKPEGTLIFCEEDPVLKHIALNTREDIESIPYGTPEFNVQKGITYLIDNHINYPLGIFGRHNLKNLNGARMVCNALGIKNEQFYHSITSFKGAAKRLEKISENEHIVIFQDFAHAPSKVKATTEAVREQYPDRTLLACLELHTYSSLSAAFLKHYQGALDVADVAIVYFNPHAIHLKKLPEITTDQVKQGFSRQDLIVLSDSGKLKETIRQKFSEKMALVMMSSGDFDGMDLRQILPVH